MFLLSGFATWIASFAAGSIVKVLGALGQTFLAPILDHYQAKDAQDTARQGIWSKAMVSSLNAEVERAKVASAERVALWHDPVYKWLTVFVVIGPAGYLNSILFVSVFHDLGWVVKAAPDEYVGTAMSIVLSFVGVLGGSAAIVGAVREFKKPK